ncbi:hypothetical protein SUGI_0577460 [Cryptomeria japonica]|uniref:uncharacterized protein LOC131035767 n=1 Tax=Cryptomeria japonica TaxID=3369 RepID=UPI002408B123|nr:uncharacterized protein LOC131035767 [Cryptomeria japonica]GLJ29284.1 hypothetical protein SUGI_0577460 [Cryptomeria japonica]
MAGGDIANEAFELLKSRGWYLKDVNVVQQVLQEMDQHPRAMEKFVEGKLLDMDLKAIGDKCLPDASAMQRLSHLHGPKVLQIVSLRNILESSSRAVVTNQQQHGRLLRICLTDGHSNVTAIEYRPFASIPTDLAPGTKVRLETTAPVQSGILLLENHSLCILGGRVQSLYEEWEMDCKYSGLFRSTLNSPQNQGSSGPPPFERIEISTVQSQTLHKLQASTSMNKQMAKQTTSFIRSQNTATEVLMHDAAVVQSGRNLPGTRTGQTKDDVGSSKNGRVTSERVRGGYELYRPKASEHRPGEKSKPSSEALDNSSRFSNLDMDVLSGKQEQGGSVESLISSELQTNESRKNEILGGQPDVVNQKTLLVTEAVPVQNQAAAQKLLKKMTDMGRGGGENRNDRFGRSRGRHNGKGKREEAALLTLDEWEMQNGRTNAISCRNDDVSQDAELARQLQTQLDLEAANVRMSHEDEAEKIRMSVFNFRNMSDNNQSGLRKPRGRGRGKRRFN